MAYASLVSLEQTTDTILNHHKYSISVDAREIISSICEYVIFLIPFLENFPEKANRLEGKIRDLANEAEDLIEFFMCNQFQMGWSVGLSRGEFESRLQRVREEMGSITGDLMDDRLCHLPAAISSSRVADTAKNDVVIGLDDDLLAIKGRLCGESSKLEVIPVVGMGGIGKTTLARNAYDDPLVMEYFAILMWVTVSHSTVDEILSRLISVRFLAKRELPMREKVYKSLKGKRYLIVMDDIWSTQAWAGVRNILPNDNNGSRIVITTRLSDVAAYASSGSPLHQMKFMDENQSWDLIEQKTFTNGQNCPRELEDVGKEIARGCKGLPLAVVLVAGILFTIIKTRASWERIGKNVHSVVDEQLDKILSLSYMFLPHHLRPCFLFMAGFLDDRAINVSRLIKLWVAEGFLKHENGCKSLEEEAEECLEDLVKRSLVLITSRKSNGKIKSCDLHDLVRDMCIRKAQEEKFLLTDRYILPNGRKDERPIRIGNSCLDKIQSTTMRTILCFRTLLDSSSLPCLEYFRLLRVLDILHGNYVLLPPQLFELFHLRFLALAFTDIPAAISKLENLQTLIICPRINLRSYTPFSYDLPLEIWRMPNLRHLVFINYYTLPDPEEGQTPLQYLQTLSLIASLACNEKILKMIPNLKKLGIIYFRNEERQDLHNLVNLRQLEKLKITASGSFSWPGRNPVFPMSLTKLSLVGGGLSWKDMSVVGSLPNLKVLKLKDDACYGDTWETSYGEFPQLNTLLIEGSKLQCWITETDHFPRLKRLVLHNCWYLQEIPDGVGEIPTLEVIEVDDLNGSLLNSAKQIQEDQQSYGNDALQLHCIHSQQVSII